MNRFNLGLLFTSQITACLQEQFVLSSGMFVAPTSNTVFCETAVKTPIQKRYTCGHLVISSNIYKLYMCTEICQNNHQINEEERNIDGASAQSSCDVNKRENLAVAANEAVRIKGIRKKKNHKTTGFVTK